MLQQSTVYVLKLKVQLARSRKRNPTPQSQRERAHVFIVKLISRAGAFLKNNSNQKNGVMDDTRWGGCRVPPGGGASMDRPERSAIPRERLGSGSMRVR
jgi:hypothetical protein